MKQSREGREKQSRAKQSEAKAEQGKQSREGKAAEQVMRKVQWGAEGTSLQLKMLNVVYFHVNSS